MLLRRSADEAEAPLLAASPPLVYRAVKLNIRLGRWVRAKELADKAKAHVDTVFAYRARHLALTGAAETLPAFMGPALAAAPPHGPDQWPAIKARKDAEKAAEASRPGARALPCVAALELPSAGGGSKRSAAAAIPEPYSP